MWINRIARTLISSTVFFFLLLLCSACSKRTLPPQEQGKASTIDRSVVAEEASRARSEALKIPAQSEAQYNFLRGQLALNEERYTDALDFFKEASRLETSPAPTLRKSLAQLYIRMGRVDDALFFCASFSFRLRFSEGFS